jgi:hypothetical protein
VKPWRAGTARASLAVLEGDRLRRPRLVDGLVEQMPVRGMHGVLEEAALALQPRRGDDALMRRPGHEGSMRLATLVHGACII